MKVEDVKLVELPRFLDTRGNLSFLEQNNHIPFEIKRTYWVYDVPGGEVATRETGFAEHTQQEVLGRYWSVGHDTILV